MIKTDYIKVETEGNTEIINITSEVKKIAESSGIKEGVVSIFVAHTTAGLAIMEFEPGSIKDLKEEFEKLAPSEKTYHHGDVVDGNNGQSHIRGALLKPCLTVPLVDKGLVLGTWQSIVLVDFDIKKRERKVVVQVVGE